MKNLIKKNILSIKPSSTLIINEKAKQLSKQGKKIYNFGFGQSPFPVPEKIVNTLRDNAHKKAYLPIQGLSDLRESVSNYLSRRTNAIYPKENILITPGSKEAMLLMHVAFKGEIILPAPSWVSYGPQAQIAKNKIHWTQTLRENNWFPTAQQIEKKIKVVGKNKNIILIINSPNNPSGTICPNLKKIAEVARKFRFSRARAGKIVSELFLMGFITKGKSAHRNIRIEEYQQILIGNLQFNREYPVKDTIN